ncbi:hypothetical protein PVAP13_J020820 [Panicum virgatum]|nr:hypothetical protein PVAP13_J020820 [Panicum virgatum]KAG2481447.1 hypothetical protein PVAP13_J020820 [Panicum virgatum]
MAPPATISTADLDHSQESHEEQGKKRSQKRSEINMISSPKCVVDAIAALSQDQKNKIKELGFGELLKFSLDGFGDRYMLEFLMDHTDPENMEIRVGGGDKNLPINEHVVQCVLGVPTGKGRDTPDSPYMESELNNLRTELGVKTDKIKSSDLIAKINGGGTDYLTIRCFFILLCYKLLFPGSQNHVTKREVALTHSPKDIAEVNWAKAVVDNLRSAARKWHSDKLAVSKKKRTLSGSVTFLLLYYLDHLRSPHSIPCIITPRTSVYTTDIIKKIIKADKRSRSGHIYGLLDFRSMVGTCYSMGSRQLVPNIRIEPLHSNFFQDLSPRKREIATSYVNTVEHSNFFQDLSPRKREIATSYVNTVDILMEQILKERNQFMISMGAQDAQNSSRAAEPQGGDSGIQDDPRNEHSEAYPSPAADDALPSDDTNPREQKRKEPSSMTHAAPQSSHGTPTSPRASVDTPDVSNDLLHPPETTQEDASLHPTQQIQEEDLETPVAPVRPHRVVRPVNKLTYSKKQIRRRRK